MHVLMHMKYACQSGRHDLYVVRTHTIQSRHGVHLFTLEWVVGRLPALFHAYVVSNGACWSRRSAVFVRMLVFVLVFVTVCCVHV